ncbi:uncharacterized protein LOC113520846 [Galleria mellonella]|uniref:Uncharacterized protein LOC113520846 n=1 Tax=Galleria mellonella TaxID=7137 RepID=A0A6J1WZU9_GALME|nr:uncharacterized protein LOC113520846 [Galleria mellonella]
MLYPKWVLSFLLLCCVCDIICKPTDHDVTQGRGISSTVWGWITYPFSWWSSEEAKPPVNDMLIGLPTQIPPNSIEVSTHNVTVWCNDQLCTTMRCFNIGCKYTICNIYDTDLNGECREYVTKPQETTSSKPTEPTSKSTAHDQKTEATTMSSQTIIAITPIPNSSQAINERPLALEAALSSTVIDSDKPNPNEPAKNQFYNDKV